MGFDAGGEFYTVDLPGVQDIVSVPRLDDKARIAERLQLMRSAHSALPEGFGWMPSWIAHIDDARQWLDLAAPIAIPTMLAIPALGPEAAAFYLSVREILVGASSFLYIFTNGEAGKQNWFNSTGKMLLGRAATTDLLKGYAQRGPWGTALSAASKISYRLTGYGINVLPIWSCVTDAFWGTIRAAQGKRVVVRLPPSSDMGVAAARYLLGAFQQSYMFNGLSLDDQKLLLIANATASQQLAKEQSLLDPAKMEVMSTAQVAYTAPSNPASLEVLDEQLGYKVGVDAPPAVPVALQSGTYTDLASDAWNRRIAHENHLKAVFGNNKIGQLYQALLVDAGLAGWSTLADGNLGVKPNFPLPVVTIGHAIEADVWPPWIKDRTFPFFGVQGSTEEDLVQKQNTPRAWLPATDVENIGSVAIRAWADLMAEMWRTGGPPGSVGGRSPYVAAGAIWGAFSTVSLYPGQPGYTLGQWQQFKANQRWYPYTLRHQLSMKPAVG